jgi:hypothetical protein
MSEQHGAITLIIKLTSDTIPSAELRQALFSTKETLAMVISDHLAKELRPVLKDKPDENFEIVIEQDWW